MNILLHIFVFIGLVLITWLYLLKAIGTFSVLFVKEHRNQFKITVGKKWKWMIAENIYSIVFVVFIWNMALYYLNN